MNSKATRRISKFLSLLLRHRPEAASLQLDSQGYVQVDVLIDALHSHGWPDFTKQDLDYVVKNNNKKRFAYSDDGCRIRASQGHSVQVELDLQPITPPDLLYHGTVNQFLSAIKREGLKKRSRQHVHLSKDIATATNVGSRRGSPIILTINAGAMHRTGYDFYLSANGVWLTDAVPAAFIEFPQ